MALDLPLINGTWQALQPSLREAKCIGCECLQGALVELRMAAEEMPHGPEQGQVLAAVKQAMDVEEHHGCLRCEPCEPSDILVAFYREQQAREVAAACACGEG